jgi:hypothetical protein
MWVPTFRRHHRPSIRCPLLASQKSVTSQKARVFNASYFKGERVRNDAVGWGTALQTGRSRARFSIVSLEFFIDTMIPAALWPWGRLRLNRNEYQEYFMRGKGGRCLGLTTLPPLCADCLEIWWPQPPGALRACPGFALPCFTVKTTFLLHFYLNFDYVPPRKPRASHLLWSISSLCIQVLSMWEPNDTHNTLCCWCVEFVFAGALGSHMYTALSRMNALDLWELRHCDGQCPYCKGLVNFDIGDILTKSLYLVICLS